jgi:hypothetical protein
MYIFGYFFSFLLLFFWENQLIFLYSPSKKLYVFGFSAGIRKTFPSGAKRFYLLP